jgi:hypothetical protein
MWEEEGRFVGVGAISGVVERGVGASDIRCVDSIDAARDEFAGEKFLGERLLVGDSGRSREMCLIGELFLGLGLGLGQGLGLGLPWPPALSANRAASNSSLVILEGEIRSSRFLDENASGNPFAGDVLIGDVRSFSPKFLDGLEILNTLCGASSSYTIPAFIGVIAGATFSWSPCSMWDMKGEESGSCHELSMYVSSVVGIEWFA